MGLDVGRCCAEDGSDYDLERGFLKPFEYLNSVIRSRCLAIDTIAASCHRFNKRTRIFLKHRAQVGNVLGVEVRGDVLPAAYMLCAIHHDQALLPQYRRQQTADEI